MTTFALVHGAWHGAWCWERAIPELEQRGHRAVAMDMPIDEPSAGWNEYADAVVDAIADEGDDVVLVGHSMGGYVIPIVAERRPVSVSVFLAAGMPLEASFSAMLANHRDQFCPGLLERMTWSDDGASTWSNEHAVDIFYNDCEADDAQLAVSRLRKQYMHHAESTYPIASFPNTPSTYVVCARDHAVNPAWGRRMAAELGMDVVEMDASHSPFWSMPATLADVLVAIV